MEWRQAATGVVVAFAVAYGGVLVHHQMVDGRSAGVIPGSTRAREGNLPGDLAPSFSLTTLNGQQLTLASLQGRPVWINFWATWCRHCRQELALIEHEKQLYGNRVVVVGVDMEQSRRVVASFSRNRGLTYPVALDTNGAVSAAYGVKGLPTSVFVAPNGIIRAVLEGAMPSSQVASQYLQKILH